MDRTLRHRMTALLAAVLFLLSGAGDAFGAHPCPHHAAIQAPDYAAAAPAADHAATSSGMDHAGHGAAHDGPAAPAEHDGHASCTCGGICPIATGPAPVAPLILPLVLVTPAAAPAAHPDEAGLPARIPAHLLPFAQAPPLSA